MGCIHLKEINDKTLINFRGAKAIPFVGLMVWVNTTSLEFPAFSNLSKWVCILAIASNH